MLTIFGENVFGLEVDAQTRCAHYHSPLDVIAIKFKCCAKWFPCFECHAAAADHEPETWKNDEREAKAVLCGLCGFQLQIAEYLICSSVCPNCGGNFNPKCESHYDLYFG